MGKIADRLKMLQIGDSLIADNGAQIDYVDIGDGFVPCFVFAITTQRDDVWVRFIAAGAAHQDASDVERYVSQFDWAGVNLAPPTRWTIRLSGSEKNPCWNDMPRVGWDYRKPIHGYNQSLLYVLPKYMDDKKALVMYPRSKPVSIERGQVFFITQKRRIWFILQVVSFEITFLRSLRLVDCWCAGHEDPESLIKSLYKKSYTGRDVRLLKTAVRPVDTNIGLVRGANWYDTEQVSGVAALCGQNDLKNRVDLKHVCRYG